MGSLLPHLNAVVLCGRTGDELWPLVRRKLPRETVTLPGEDRSLLVATIERLKPFVTSFTFVAAEDIAGAIESCVKASALLKRKDYEIIVETCPRGSAFPIALAAAKIRRRDPNAYVLVMPSHLKVEADDRWEQAVMRCYRVAAEDMVAVMGIPSKKSSSPHSFIRPSAEIKGIVGARRISDYIASPSPNQTSRYIQLGMLWSTGIMMAHASTVLAQLVYVAKHAPNRAYRSLDRIAETASFLVAIDEENWRSDEARELVASLPEASFETAVLSSSDSVAVVPASFEFSEVTTLKSVDDMAEPDEFDNRIIGRGFAIDSENTTIYDDDRLTVVLGCDDLLVVNTRDSVLVASKDALDTLGEVVPELVDAGASEAETSSVAEHGWGTATTLFESQGCSVKILRILPGRSIPEYARKGSNESWQVLEGSIEYTLGDESLALSAGEQITFSPRERHGFSNATKKTVTLMCTEFDS